MSRKAGAGVSFIATGDKEIDRALKKLETRIQKKAVNRSLRAGAKILRDGVLTEVPEGDTRELKRSIKVRAAKRTKKGFGVNVITGEGFFKGRQFYGGFVEYGTKQRGTGKPKGKAAPGIPARHYMEKGFSKQASAARSAMIAALRSDLNNI